MNECGQAEGGFFEKSQMLHDLHNKCRTYSFTHMIGMHVHLSQQSGVFDKLYKCIADRPSVPGKSHPEESIPNSVKQCIR